MGFRPVHAGGLPRWGSGLLKFRLGCCGSTPHATKRRSAWLPVLNLQKARAMDLPVLTACASCYSRLRSANHAVRNDPEERDRAGRITGKPYDGGVEVRHLLDVLVNDIGPDAIRGKVRRPLKGLKVACYYGCLLTRPPGIAAFENAEHPISMDRLLAAAGAESLEWPYKTECCGARCRSPVPKSSTGLA
jgi:heterodisulfide reductase subunit B